MSAIAYWSPLAMSICEVTVSDLMLFHCQDVLQDAKKWVASTRKEPEKCSSLRLALAAIRLTARTRVRVDSGAALAGRLPGWKFSNIINFFKSLEAMESKRALKSGIHEKLSDTVIAEEHGCKVSNHLRR